MAEERERGEGAAGEAHEMREEEERIREHAPAEEDPDEGGPPDIADETEGLER